MRLHLGCGRHRLDGYVNVDARPVPAADVVLDLEGPWPWSPDSADEIVAHHILEHFQDLPAFMDKAHRVLRVGGVLDVRVPHHRHRNADTDPTHRIRFTEHSFAYWEPDTSFEPFSDLHWRCIRHDVVGGLRVPLLWRVYAPARYWYIIAPNELRWRLVPIKEAAGRNLLALALARALHDGGHRVGWRDRGSEWPILTMDLPTGEQVSYHLPADEATRGAQLPDYADEWDGHDLAEKQRRVLRYVNRGEGAASPEAVRSGSQPGRTP